MGPKYHTLGKASLELSFFLNLVLAFYAVSHQKRKKAYRDFMCVLANKFSYSRPSVLSIDSVPRSDPFRKSIPKFVLQHEDYWHDYLQTNDVIKATFIIKLLLG